MFENLTRDVPSTDSELNKKESSLLTTDARKSRKAVFRRTIDYNASAINYLKDRIYVSRERERPMLQPDFLWSPKLCPPRSYMDSPMNCVMSKPVRTSTNKNKCPIYCVCWTPEGRRLITGAFSGEFTLWNGLTFNFETILQAHESQIRCMKWSHNEEWLLTADHSGYVKYWQANMNNVEMYQAHKEPIRGVSFCPFDNKFVTCSDDSTVRIWDFHRCSEERVLRGHGSDVRSVAWHPILSLIISGSKDAQQPIKLWDPKTGESVSTLYVHKNTCTDVAWNDNGNWFLTASRDHLIKLFDLRNLKSEIQTFRGHKRDVMRVAWHPFHECLFASGSADGAIFYWAAGTETELGAVDNAHESMIWSLAWHPFGHILVSGANDFATKFWTRSRPGDVLKETLSGIGSEGFMQTSGVLTNNLSLSDPEAIENNSFNADLAKLLSEPPNRMDNLEELAFTNSVEPSADIPGLNEGPVIDLNVVDADDSEEREKNKLRITRMIPKEFAANWASTRITAMPAVMMPTPNPNALAAAAAAAAAAVNTLNSTPQYLPPVKPTPIVVPDAALDQQLHPNHTALTNTDTMPYPHHLSMKNPDNGSVSNDACTNDLNASSVNPLPFEQHSIPPVNDQILAHGSEDALKSNPNWAQRNQDLRDQAHFYRQPSSEDLLHGQPDVRLPQLYENQKRFIDAGPTSFPRHSDDCDYRDHDSKDHHGRFPTREPFYDGPIAPPIKDYNSSSSHGAVARNSPYGEPAHINEPSHNTASPSGHIPYDRRGDRFPTLRPNYECNEGWRRGWTENKLRPDHFDFDQHTHPRRFPIRDSRAPPTNFHPDPRALPPNYFPPHKRPPPPGLHPDNMGKYPRPEFRKISPNWTTHNQWR